MNHLKTRSGSGKLSSRAELSFRERALVEAFRYGSDSWVFLRELLQNARDAGAHRVDLTVTESDGLERLVCRDDGSGMSAVHAHRYLFALYASSKESDHEQAGQFGVGFWSVLRFQPEKVIIRSKPRQGEAWQVDLDQRLDNAVFSTCEMARGTEIILERRPSHPARNSLADKVHGAVFRYGRFLTRRQESTGRFRRHRHQPLAISVNGRPVADEMTLPPPSVSFHRRGFRGVVALGAEPRVELFANGLFVRQTTCLEDLVADPAHDDKTDSPFSLDLPGSLAPQILLDSSQLELLLARSDVRQSRHLERMIQTAEKELEGLIERQLETVRPHPWFVLLSARARQWLHRLQAWRLRLSWWLAPIAVLGILLGWVLAGWMATEQGARPWHLGLPSWPSEHSQLIAADNAPAGRSGLLSDLGRGYQGPRLDPENGNVGSFELVYEPSNDTALFLTALVVEDPNSWSSAEAREGNPVGPYSGATCQDSPPQDSPTQDSRCVSIRLLAGKGNLRLPVPTGHLLDPASVHVGDKSRPVYVTANGEPLVMDLQEGDQLEYRTAMATVPASYQAKIAPDTPAQLTALAIPLRGLPMQQRVEQAIQQVARLVQYDRSAAAVAQHRAEIAARRGFAEAALTVGKGDCDVQNGVLVLLLREAGVTARLAIGYVGQSGKVAPALHAWVEYLGADQRWHVADVSKRSAVGSSRLAWITGSAESAANPLRAADMVIFTPGPRPSETPGIPLFASWRGKYDGLLLASLVAVCLGLGWTRARRQHESRQQTHLAEPDLAALLGGALQHPGLSRMPSLLHGRLIPLITPADSSDLRTSPRPHGHRQPAISLHEAQKRSGQNRLFSSMGTSQLARAAARNWPVIDMSQAEGRITSLGLGATDLDEWSNLLERGTTSGLIEYLNEYLDDIGQDWRLLLSSPLSEPLKIIDLSLMRLGRRQVLIDPQSADFMPIGPRHDNRCASTAFRLLDAVVDHLDLPRAERGKLLVELARRVVLEQSGNPEATPPVKGRP